MMVATDVGGDRAPVPVHHLVVDVRARLVQLLHRARRPAATAGCSCGSRSMTEPIVIAWSSCSTIAADTSASCSIQKTCSAEDVG